MKRFDIRFWSHMSFGSCGVLSSIEIEARNLKSAINKFKKHHYPNDPTKRKKAKFEWSKIISIQEITRADITGADVVKALKSAKLPIDSCKIK